MLPNKAVVRLNQPEGSFLLNLTLFPSGPASVLNRIPSNIAGIYAWFQSFEYPDDPDQLYDVLLKDIMAPKFIPRYGAIKPFYEVTIGSRNWFSEKKKSQLISALRDETFRRGLLDSLEWSVLFQTPLYIGRSSNLKKRIDSHLKEGSILRERLGLASIDIHKTLLLIVPNSITEAVNISYSNDEHEEISDSEPNEVAEAADDAYEGLYEEIFSRLFSPSFTIRLG